MAARTTPHPPIQSRAQWRAARLQLLRQEKNALKEYDRVSAKRRRLPMVRVEQDYRFETPLARGACATFSRVAGS